MPSDPSVGVFSTNCRPGWSVMIGGSSSAKNRVWLSLDLPAWKPM
jgi:hypothetical protein